MIYLLSRLYKEIDKESEFFMYYGKITDQLTEAITGIQNSDLANDGGKQLLATEKKTLFLIVESVQNIIRHGARKSTEQKGLMVISKKKDGLYLTTGNSIDARNVDDLRQKIDKINQMKEQDLKIEYKRILTEESFSEQGGAGLGLIQIARKTLQKIDYSFEKIDATHYFFLMVIKIPKNSLRSAGSLKKEK